MLSGRISIKFVSVLVLLAVSVFTIAFVSASTPGNVTSCQTLDTAGVYTLNQSLSSVGTCLTITASGVILDGNNFSINFNTGGTTNSAGVYFTGTRNNATVRNMNLNDSGGGLGNDVSGVRSDGIITNSSFIHLNIATYGGFSSVGSHAIYFKLASANNNISYNRINSSSSWGTNGEGIYFKTTSSGDIMSYNIIYTYNGDAISFATSSSSSANATIFNNVINSSGKGIFFYTKSTNSTIYFNIINSSGNGIDLGGTVVGNTVFRNNITNLGGSYGISFEGTSTNNSLLNNNVITLNIGGAYDPSTSKGIGVGGSSGDVIANNTILSFGAGIDISPTNGLIEGNVISASNGTCVALEGNSLNNNRVIGNNVTCSFGYAVNLNIGGTMSNNTFFDNNFTTLAGDGIIVGGGNVQNNNFSNNLITADSGDGFDFTFGGHNIINNLFLHNTISAPQGIGMNFGDDSANNTISYGILNAYSDGLSFATASNSTISNNLINSTLVDGFSGFGGILFEDSVNNLVKNNTIISKSDGISFGTSRNLVLDSNSMTSSYNDLTIGFWGGDRYLYLNSNLTLVDQEIGNYTIYSSNITFIDSRNGRIVFLSEINGSGSNLFGGSGSGADIVLGSDLVAISESQSGLNTPASITLYGVPTSFVEPFIARDGILCSDCSNFTSLNAGNVTFNISSFGSYAILDAYVAPSSGNPSSGGGSTGTPSYWAATYPALGELTGKVSKTMANRGKIEFNIGGESHTLGIISLAGGITVINISSNPVQISLKAGEEKKLNVNGGAYYDLLVKVVSIVDNMATISLTPIHEAPSPIEIGTPTGAVTASPDENIPTSVPQDRTSSLWIWIPLLVIIITLIVLLLFRKKKS